MQNIATEIILVRGNTLASIARLLRVHLPVLPAGSVLTMNSTAYRIASAPNLAIAPSGSAVAGLVTLKVYVTEADAPTAPEGHAGRRVTIDLESDERADFVLTEALGDFAARVRAEADDDPYGNPGAALEWAACADRLREQVAAVSRLAPG